MRTVVVVLLLLLCSCHLPVVASDSQYEDEHDGTEVSIYQRAVSKVSAWADILIEWVTGTPIISTFRYRKFVDACKDSFLLGLNEASTAPGAKAWYAAVVQIASDVSDNFFKEYERADREATKNYCRRKRASYQKKLNDRAVAWDFETWDFDDQNASDSETLYLLGLIIADPRCVWPVDESPLVVKLLMTSMLLGDARAAELLIRISQSNGKVKNGIVERAIIYIRIVEGDFPGVREDKVKEARDALEKLPRGIVRRADARVDAQRAAAKKMADRIAAERARYALQLGFTLLILGLFAYFFQRMIQRKKEKEITQPEVDPQQDEPAQELAQESAQPTAQDSAPLSLPPGSPEVEVERSPEVDQTRDESTAQAGHLEDSE